MFTVRDDEDDGGNDEDNEDGGGGGSDDDVDDDVCGMPWLARLSDPLLSLLFLPLLAAVVVMVTVVCY